MNQNQYCIYNFDSPNFGIKKINNRNIEIRGWIIAKEGYELKKIELRTNYGNYEFSKGLERLDIKNVFSDLDENKTLYSGFSLDYDYNNGLCKIVAILDKGESTLKEFEFDVEKDIISVNYNPFLAQNVAEHNAVIETKNSLWYEEPDYQKNKTYNKTARLIAFYLPQYHPFKENDDAWGKGFTEWTNVATGQPRFSGHNQPFLPSDFGYYDLRVDDIYKEQINLAKKAGIDAFCFYYYWFSGKKVMDMPLNKFIKNKDWNFNFMICWANENWTKRWDGRDDDVILEQKYLEEDPLVFIKDIEHVLLDERYVRHNGKPVLAVYRPEKLDNPKKYTKIWKDYFREKHGLDLHLLYCMGFSSEEPKKFGFDAGIEFSPSTFMRDKTIGSADFVGTINKKIDKEFVGGVINYRRMVKNVLRRYDKPTYDFTYYKGINVSWDNDARKKGKNPYVFIANNPLIFQVWLNEILKNANDFVFINAWNEWAEGTVLEPTRHYGHTYTNRINQVIYGKNHQEYEAIISIYCDSVLSYEKLNTILSKRVSKKESTLVLVNYPDNLDSLINKDINLGSNNYIKYYPRPNYWLSALSFSKDFSEATFSQRARNFTRLIIRDNNLDKDAKTADKVLKIAYKKLSRPVLSGYKVENDSHLESVNKISKILYDEKIDASDMLKDTNYSEMFVTPLKYTKDIIDLSINPDEISIYDLNKDDEVLLNQLLIAKIVSIHTEADVIKNQIKRKINLKFKDS